MNPFKFWWKWVVSFFKEKDDLVPDSDHVLRYIKPSGIQDDVINGSEFLKRPNEEEVSVNWIEYFQGTLESQIEKIRQKARLTYARTGRLARLNVGQTCSYVLEETNRTFNLSVVKDRLPEDKENGFEEDPSHALIKGGAND